MQLIYLFNQSGSTLYKIGRTKDVNKRLKQLQTGTPFLLEITKIFTVNSKIESKLEKTIHRRFNSYKTQGEWFDFDTLNIDYVNESIRVLMEAILVLEETI